VQVVDDVLSDDHPTPTDNWWNDDCVEVFLDENRSKGDHWKNNNAFAYHVSTKYDAIDLDSNGNPINLKNNIIVRMDTIGVHTYMWEIAIKVYTDKFSTSNPEASRVTLTPRKLSGFTLAYCDNDLTTSRENFIGSMTMPTSEDVNYKTADYFGSLLLVDQLNTSSSLNTREQKENLVKVFPTSATNYIKIEKVNGLLSNISIDIISITGAINKRIEFANNSHVVDISGLKQGIYFLKIQAGNSYQIEKIIKK
jgi:hypothetical protein